MNIGDTIEHEGQRGVVVCAATARELDAITDDTLVTFDTPEGMSCTRRAGDCTVIEPATQDVLDAQTAFLADREKRAKLNAGIGKVYGGPMWAAYSGGAFLALCPDVTTAKGVAGCDEVRPAVLDGVIMTGTGDTADAAELVAMVCAVDADKADVLRAGVAEAAAPIALDGAPVKGG
jgi:hypothetical protein